MQTAGTDSRYKHRLHSLRAEVSAHLSLIATRFPCQCSKKMKLLLLALLPLALASPMHRDRRMILDTLQQLGGQALAGLLEGMGMDLTQLKTIVTGLAVTLEGDETEAKCEAACPGITDQVLSGDSEDTLHTVVHAGCPLICTGLQSLVHMFNVNVLHTGTTA